jgi:hypothetical protein
MPVGYRAVPTIEVERCLWPEGPKLDSPGLSSYGPFGPKTKSPLAFATNIVRVRLCAGGGNGTD